jgi:cell division protein FtsL
MIRPATFLAMLVFVFAGLFLYQTKHKAQLLDREIARTLRETNEARTRITLLKAEYALLGDPERLQALAAQYLTLKPTQPTQFTTLADLPRRLPPPGPLPGRTVEPVEPPAAEIQPISAPAAPPAAPPPAQPPALVAAAPKPPAPRPPAPKPALVASNPPPQQVSTPPSTPAPTVVRASAVGGSLIRPVARPAVMTAQEAPAPSTTADAIRQIVHGGRVDPNVPAVASALGMARSLTGAPDIAARAQTRGETNRN